MTGLPEQRAWRRRHYPGLRGMSESAPIEHPSGLTSGDFTEAEDPLRLFATWFEEATRSEPRDPTAMSLATVDADGLPNVRMVLMKSFGERGFVFYTNVDSNKVQARHARGALAKDATLSVMAFPAARKLVTPRKRNCLAAVCGFAGMQTALALARFWDFDLHGDAALEPAAPRPPAHRSEPWYRPCHG